MRPGVAIVMALGMAAGACERPPAAPASASLPFGAIWSYDVRATPSFDLEVDATFRAGVSGELLVDSDATPFVDRVEVQEGTAFRPASRAAIRCAAPCRVRYRVRLRDAARARRDPDLALEAGGALLAPPSTWLLRPEDVPRAGRYRFHVASPPGARFVTGVRPAQDGAADTYEADVGALDEASFAAFGALRVHRLAEPGVDVALAPTLSLPEDVAVKWAKAEVDALTSYLGHVPDDRAVVFMVPGGQEVTRGKTLGDGGASVLIRVGTAVTPANVLEDWVLAHELVHVGSPYVARPHAWFGEGLATYVEPIVRARAGLCSPEKVWADLVEGLPKGLPKGDDGGLDASGEIDRVYWGGALVYLLADIALREQSKGAKSLDDVMRAWLRAGGNVEAHWPLERALEVGDAATGTRVLHDLYARFGPKPASEDLAALWARLGVRPTGGSVTFDDRAPLASVRSAITGKP